MSDIVERLRLSVTKSHEPTDEDAISAANEIERLRAALKDIAIGVGESVLSQDAMRARASEALTGRKTDPT